MSKLVEARVKLITQKTVLLAENEHHQYVFGPNKIKNYAGQELSELGIRGGTDVDLMVDDQKVISASLRKN